jgi:restriction endonuclease
LNPSLLAQAIWGIPSSKSIVEFQSTCKISSYTSTIELLDFLINNGIGTFSNSRVMFSAVDKLKVTLLALQHGCELGLISSKLDWRDFELFTTAILERTKYTCQTNIQTTKPRCQIDVVAISREAALIIDCKHWKAMSVKSMIACANQQCNRAEVYMQKQKKLNVGIPLIVTLHDAYHTLVNKVPFVSICKFASFLDNFSFYEDQLYRVSRI